MKTTLPPIVHLDAYTEAVEDEILDFFREVLFDPIKDLLASEYAPTRVNGEYPAVREALVAGAIWYADGHFRGRFQAATSRELLRMGASRTGEGFYLAQERVPLDLRSAVTASKLKSEHAHQEILTLLLAMLANVGAATLGSGLPKRFDGVLERVRVQADKTLEGFSSSHVLGAAERLREKYVAQTTQEIQGFSVESVKKIRTRVEENLAAGGRIDRLAKVLETEFGVVQRKARFIAEQETSLLVAQYREQRYTEAGFAEYLWETAGDELVRPDHRALNGRRFSWSSPPIVDHATGRRCHPGQDYNCRCVARPIVNV